MTQSRPKPASFRLVLGTLACALWLPACDGAPDPEPDDAALTEEDGAGELRLTAVDDGAVEGTLAVDGEVITVAVSQVNGVRDLVVTGAEEYARWSFDIESELTVGHIGGYSFGRFEDRFHSLDQDYWSEMRASHAASVARIVAAASQELEVLEVSPQLIGELGRLSSFVDNLGVVPEDLAEELGGDLSNLEFPPSEELDDLGDAEPAVSYADGFQVEIDPSAATCSYVSNAGHTISSVHVFQTGCRINHYSWNRKPSGVGACTNRCIRNHYSSGASASGTYCNGSGGQNLSQAHVVPRTGRTYGLWSHLWNSAGGLDTWIWRSAPCPN